MSAHEWVGRLSMALTLAKPSLPPPVRDDAERTLTDLKQSDVCTPELRLILDQHEQERP